LRWTQTGAKLHAEGHPALALLTDLSAPQRPGCVNVGKRQRGLCRAAPVTR
jgi:hypothetical protein